MCCMAFYASHPRAQASSVSKSGLVPHFDADMGRTAQVGTGFDEDDDLDMLGVDVDVLASTQHTPARPAAALQLPQQQAAPLPVVPAMAPAERQRRCEQ